jgi:hypothetical protein
MTDGTLDSEVFALTDHWPGERNIHLPEPVDGFQGETHHNVATAAYQVGTKVQVRNKGTTGKEGFATLIYLQVGVQNPYVAIAAKSVVVADSVAAWFKVTNDPDDCIALPTAQLAVALSAMTDAYFGWFWCAGVCPEELVSGLGGNYDTDGTVEPGLIRAVHLSVDEIGFGPCPAGEPGGGIAYEPDRV